MSTWYHIAMTYDGTDFKIYLNGNLDKKALVSPPSDSGLESINLGAGSGGTGQFNDGFLDEVSVWDTALTNDQLKSLYEMQKAPYVSSGLASFTSKVFEATSSASSWWKLKPKPVAPYGKELPANTETEYSSANVDMTNIVGVWHLNETHGTIYDSSGNNNHSSLVAGTPAYNQPGKFNGALNFDGTDDYVFFGTGPSMSGSTDFTVSMWLKTTKDGATGQNGMSLVSQRDPGWDGGEYLINIGRNYDGNDPNPGKVLFVVWEDGGPQVNNFWSYRRVDDGKWHHLLVVREGLTLRIYIDGTLDREATGAGPLDTLDPTYYTVFGRDELYEDRYYEGDLDEVAIWSRALSSSEVLSLYQRGALRVKYQVTGCETPTCSDASFIGPDGSSSSFFSEQSTQQSIISIYNLYPLNSSRYFQYKVIFESDNSLYSPELDDVYIFSQ
ncbi:MAG: LamG domain-containing protein [Bdellovibrionales bacterium]|nr:LamG domain-containing protein [Bdellovibrionales bacterium]